MPRQPRIDIPGLLQHVIIRGIERSDIFYDDDDRDNFLERLGRLLEETETDCFAWALMSNHVHLLLRCNRVPLAKFMRRLLTGYAVSFNRSHQRSGHLFQNRYKSIVCEEEPYFLELVRYIHLNPLRAGLVNSLEELDEYPWCGHPALIGKQFKPWQAIVDVLSHFSERHDKARMHYHTFIADGLTMGKRRDLVGGGLRRSQGEDLSGEEIEVFDDRILGGGDFVNAVLDDDARKLHARQKISLDELERNVARKFDLPETGLRQRGRQNDRSRARALFCYLAVTKLNAKCSELAKRMNVGLSSVSRSVRRGGGIFLEEARLQEWWAALLRQ
mgnify:CR=1 FL=1